LKLKTLVWKNYKSKLEFRALRNLLQLAIGKLELFVRPAFFAHYALRFNILSLIFVCVSPGDVSE